MIPQLRPEYFNLPSIQRLLESIEEDLQQRRSLFLVIPLGIDPDLVWDKIRANLWWRDLSITEIQISDGRDVLSPLDIFCNNLSIHWESIETPLTIENLLKTEELPDLIRLENLDELPEDRLGQWMAFFDSWAKANHSITNGGGNPIALVATIQNSSVINMIPNSDLFLTTYWWWRLPSILEGRLLCRIGNFSETKRVTAVWREYILPSLALGDISLLESLWNIDQVDLDLLVESLKIYAKDRGWDREELIALGVNQPGLLNQAYSELSTPPKGLHLLWIRGIICSTPEHGTEIHSAALALLGQTEDILHRLWRGQAELLLPMIDDFRLRICRRITIEKGDDWPLRWHQPDSLDEIKAVQESPLAVQLGYLEWLLNNSIYFSEYRDYLPLVKIGRTIRNQLAHYKPVTYQEYNLFGRALGKLDHAI